MRIVDLGIGWIDVLRYQALLEHPVGRVLVSGLDVIRHDSHARRNAFGEPLRVIGRRLLYDGLAGDQAVVAPDRHAVAAPIERERPARDRLARIPLALAVMQEPAWREAVTQAADQI